MTILEDVYHPKVLNNCTGFNEQLYTIFIYICTYTQWHSHKILIITLQINESSACTDGLLLF